MGRWPIFWRSTKPLRFRPSLGILMGIAFVAFCYVAAVIGEYDHVGVHAFFLTAMLCVLAVLLSVLSATAVSGEWQQRTLGVLLCTPITSARIVLEKLLGVLWRLRWLYAVILAHVDLFCALGVIRWQAIPNVVMLLAWTTVYATGSGVFLSAFCRTTLSAAMVSLGQLAILWGILPFLLPPVAGALAPSNPQRFCEQASGYFNASPPYQLVNTIENSCGHRSEDLKLEIVALAAEEVAAQSNSVDQPSQDRIGQILQRQQVFLAAADARYGAYWSRLTLRQLSQASVGAAIGVALTAAAVLTLRRRVIA